MDRLRLDPAAPLASLLAWLDALFKALGIDPSAYGKVRLDYASLAELRGWLADWSGQLRALARREAALLAFHVGVRIGVKRGRRGSAGLPLSLVERGNDATASGGVGPGSTGRTSASFLRLGPPHTPCPLSTRERGMPCAPEPQRPRRTRPAPSTQGPAGRIVAVAGAGRSIPSTEHIQSAGRPRRPRRTRPAPDAWISDDEDAAIRARVHAVLDAMADPCDLIRRLALRLGRRLARAKAVLAALRGRRRFPLPPRAIGARRSRTLAPEPRPPNLRASVPA